ncbi:MAG TPA: DUF1801 domain-containing protein [Gemmatimonadota bacterium]|nr:DUF1801 domain-containing protein [Gemmatimonadota bacterium]
MVRSSATTVEEYLEELPEDRRRAISTVRDVVRRNLPQGYRESINWGMISYEVPLERYPDTYNKQPLCIAGLAAQKNYNSLYLMSVYGDPEKEKRLKEAFRKAGKKPNMGKSCLRFRSPDDLPLAAIGEIIASTPPEALIAASQVGRAKTR